MNMRRNLWLIIGLSLIVVPVACLAQSTETTDLWREDSQFASVQLETAQRGDQKGLAVQFSGSKHVHYYATEGVGDFPFTKLNVRAEAQGISFSETIYPSSKPYFDPGANTNVPVYSGDFTVFLPIQDIPSGSLDVTVTISAQICTDTTCLMPFDKELSFTLDPTTASWKTLTVADTPPPLSESQTENSGTTWWYFLLAIGAGLSINIMPCVLPVIPLIIMKLLEQSKQAGKQRLLSGFSFCSGIVSFFILFAAITAIIQLATGSGINPNDIYRYPNAAIVLFLFIIFFALVMLDIIPIVLPSSVAGKQTSASSLVGSLGMGFFAGVLSIPCSGALLGFVLVWAQTQPLYISSLTFILIGVGMALPYAFLISIPSLMEKLPKPGTWMESFKKTCGFLLFFIAGKLTLAAIPEKERLINVILYGVVFAFSIWMWGTWVNFSTPVTRKRIIRGIALLIAIGSGFWLLPEISAPAEASLDWAYYEPAKINLAKSEGRPILLKFTADWCTNCKVVERNIYRDPDMVSLIESRNVLAVKADTTTKDMQATIDLTDIYGEAGNVPVTILLLPGQDPQKLRGIDIGESLQSLLEPLPTKEISTGVTPL